MIFFFFFILSDFIQNFTHIDIYRKQFLWKQVLLKVAYYLINFFDFFCFLIGKHIIGLRNCDNYSTEFPPVSVESLIKKKK